MRDVRHLHCEQEIRHRKSVIRLRKSDIRIMKYNIATILCNDLETWQIDVMQQELADIGFDSFEQQGLIMQAYIPADLADEHNLQETLANSGATLQSFAECPDENWNAVWEASHEVENLPLGIRITPHCAFGAGHHETTSMMISRLMDADIQGKRVFDHGTGTGVLAIFAKKLGATYVLADDIDENSVRNARENAEQNNVDIEVILASQDFPMYLHAPRPAFHLIMANIHRNILLQQMADYAALLLPGGELWVSGFYETDIPALTEKAAAHGLQHTDTCQNGDWRMLVFGSK